MVGCSHKLATIYRGERGNTGPPNGGRAAGRAILSAGLAAWRPLSPLLRSCSAPAA